ncbi:MAG: TonB-dependent receptor domain-containing protein, partial [Pseudomonadales bacterium]
QEEVLIETGPGVVATNVLNASTVDIAGVDLELQYKLTEAWSVRAAYGYLDAEFDEFTADLDGDGETPATDNTDLKLRNAPENTFGLSTTYTVPIGPGKFYAYASYRFRMR